MLDQKYQIHVAPTNKSAELVYADEMVVLKAFAFDTTRFATAAIESMADEPAHAALPKSTAWLLIRSYYAAFFAAHAIARMLGVSYTRFEPKHCKAIGKIANLFAESVGNPLPPQLSGGLYRCEVSRNKKAVTCSLLGDSGGGSHEIFWESFQALLRGVANDLLTSNIGLPENNQMASQAIDVLCDVMNIRGKQGAWLSVVRNEINYQQAWGCWYPYNHQLEKSAFTVARANKWLDDLPNIGLAVGNAEVQRFQGATSFLVSLCREMAVDMASRAPSRGSSFHSVGVLAILKLLE
ncbi:hypothetical protein [Granulicella mallensis]|uniref:Uncharacterized protein n=1 Tax=Granulicella mallensis TaxID=940614 RepID=A0A7W7ZTN4_9BACT|nr:hypothetical protein [Granulicella mallensis]MBB5065066.1 hypothetical protein [Granulicella mallensis]